MSAADRAAAGGVGVWSVGAGAIGGSVAARLARAGIRPVVVDTDPDHLARLREPGLRLVEPDGAEQTQRLDACSPAEAADRSDPCDLLLLAVRSSATEAALAPFADRAGDVVSLQNGLNEDTIAAVVGADRTIGCVVGFGATWLGPGEVELTSGGGLAVGRLDGSTDDRLDRARQVLDAAFLTQVTGDIVAQLWGKVLVNVMTVLGALGGMLTGEVLAPSRRPVVRAVVSEATAVALAEGVALSDVMGCDPVLVAERRAGWEEALDASLDAIARHFGQVRSVTWRDLELGRPTEVEAVTGEVVRRGHQHGVDVPANSAALDMLRECEAGTRRPGEVNLSELTDRAGLA